jgi:hypothetical protein
LKGRGIKGVDTSKQNYGTTLGMLKQAPLRPTSPYGGGDAAEAWGLG